MSRPTDPIAAATHPDPYPYYAELVAQRPFARDDALGLWVAADAPAVTAVLESPLCRVRPPSEPVPKALQGSPAGDIFGRLVRMNDGVGHSPMKPAVSATLGMLDPAGVAERARRWAHALVDELAPPMRGDRVMELAFRLPVYVVASLLGMPDARLSETAEWMGDFVRCLAAPSTPEQIERSKDAARRLIDAFRARLATPAESGALLDTLAREARRVGRDDADVIVANGIGFMSQAYEATAGLIGNTLVTLGRQPELRRVAAADTTALTAMIREVVRYDPPVQNTRRFVAADGVVAGQSMKSGDAVLVVLAAANRDPSANAQPDRFDVARAARQAFTFGVGVHACPGEALATAIAHAGVERLLAAGVEPARLLDDLTYRPSANTRIPMFGG
jgi:cytochrome P450